LEEGLRVLINPFGLTRTLSGGEGNRLSLYHFS
jgi:hypothetical protein